MDTDENVHIYKAWLMVKDFKQIHGIDYDKNILTHRDAEICSDSPSNCFIF
jgi:hypothetical protein